MQILYSSVHYYLQMKSSENGFITLQNIYLLYNSDDWHLLKRETYYEKNKLVCWRFIC